MRGDWENSNETVQRCQTRNLIVLTDSGRYAFVSGREMYAELLVETERYPTSLWPVHTFGLNVMSAEGVRFLELRSGRRHVQAGSERSREVRRKQRSRKNELSNKRAELRERMFRGQKRRGRFF